MATCVQLMSVRPVGQCLLLLTTPASSTVCMYSRPFVCACVCVCVCVQICVCVDVCCVCMCYVHLFLPAIVSGCRCFSDDSGLDTGAGERRYFSAPMTFEDVNGANKILVGAM